MISSPRMTAEFILDRLEVIGGSAHDRESGNEIEARMLAYLASHKKGNEEAMRSALAQWLADGVEPKLSLAKHLIKALAL